jgi:hypothetical protein
VAKKVAPGIVRTSATAIETILNITFKSLLKSIIFTVIHIGIDTIFELVVTVMEAERAKDLDKAMENAVKSFLSTGVEAILKKHESAIHDFYLRHWHKPESLFLYLSPIMHIYQEEGGAWDEYKFYISFEETGNLERMLISRKPLKPDYFEHSGWPLNAELRWSVPYPLLTPFNAASAILDVIANRVVEDWFRNGLSRNDSKTVNGLYACAVRLMAELASIFHMDYYAGFYTNQGRRKFDSQVAIGDRHQLTNSAMKLFNREIEPTLKKIEKLGLLSPEMVSLDIKNNNQLSRRLTNLLSEEKASRQIGNLITMVYLLTDKLLSYQRLNRVTFQDLTFGRARYRDDYLNELIKPILPHLPREVQASFFHISLGKPSSSSQIKL